MSLFEVSLFYISNNFGCFIMDYMFKPNLGWKRECGIKFSGLCTECPWRLLNKGTIVIHVRDILGTLKSPLYASSPKNIHKAMEQVIENGLIKCKILMISCS